MKKDDIIKAARDRMSEALEADQENREEAHDDLEFIAGRQWPEDERQDRETAGRPVITINRMPQFVRQVTGDLRRLNPAIKVVAGDTAASDDVAELIEGMVRAIENTSNGSAIYEDAAISAAQCGIGHWRILTEYEYDDSFNQCVKLAPIKNPFAVVWDPKAREPSRSDAGYCFITERMSHKDFKEAYPDANANSVDSDMAMNAMGDWYEDGDVIVAEYFWKEPVEKTIYLLQGGQVVEEKPPAPVVVLKDRKVSTHKVMWAKVSGSEVLEGPQEMPGKFIPVVAATGEEVHIGSEVVRTSVIRYAKDPQRLYNYFKSAHAEFVALQPKAPYIVTAKQVAGLETFWNEANDANRPYLPYNPDEKAPPPQRAQPPMPSAGLLQEMIGAADDMQATTGIYDAGLGQQSNEKSGVAIRQRQMESDISTSVYGDNLQRAIQHCGEILVDLIPKIYDTQRIVRIIGKDGDEQMTEVNGISVDQTGNIIPVNPLKVGRYDVRVTVGPNYSTRRQETAESMMQFVQAFPMAGQVAGDLIARAMDWPDADKLAERLEKALPPGMAPQQQPKSPQEAQAMQAQMQQQQQAQQEAQAMAKRKAVAEVAESEADAKRAMQEAKKAAADAMKAEAEAKVAIAQAAMLQAPVMRAPMPGRPAL